MPTREDLKRGSLAFEKNEPRDAMYKIATFLVNRFWGSPRDMADGVGVLLLTWNQAFYRYGSFDFLKFEISIKQKMDLLNHFRERSIKGFSNLDEDNIETLFNDFLFSLQSVRKIDNKKTPVGVSKALHLFAPNFFPIWDDKIAKAYKCNYGKNPLIAYLKFMYITREIALSIQGEFQGSKKTIIKLIDEYNYSKFTKKWI